MTYSFDYALFMMCPNCSKLKENTKHKCPINKAMSNYTKELDAETLKQYLFVKNSVVMCKEYEGKQWANDNEKKENAAKEKSRGNSKTMAMTLDVDNNTAE